jgi:putative DNA primase/helicase
MKLTIYTADTCGQESNVYYPNKVDVTDERSFKKAVSFDHVAASYKNNYRSNVNFIEADHISMDCDNEKSDDPETWISPEDILSLFDGVGLAIATSRNHLKEKGSKSARPRFHVYFPILETKNADSYSELKEELADIFLFFDAGALGSARFMFGNPDAEVVWRDGSQLITDFIRDDFAEWDAAQSEIPEGSRNKTMSHYAGRIIVRLGATEEAYEMFLKKADLCNPPLPDSELQTIWQSAKRFGKKVSAQEGYIPPEEYGKDFSLMPPDFSDIGQAKVLTREKGEILVYTDATDYMTYNGTHWEESKQKAVGVCQDFLDKQLEEAKAALNKATKLLTESGVPQDLIQAGGRTLEKGIQSEQKKAFDLYRVALAYKNFVMKRRDMKYVTSALQAAKPMLLKMIQDFDSQDFMLNTPAAAYDLTKGLQGAVPHKPEDYMTKITLFSPDTENEQLWLDAVSGFFCGDQELIEYVQQIVGLSAIGKVYMEALIISYGEGSNGKSTFWNSIAKVLGNYSGTISADALTVGCRRNVKPEIAELKGKRLVIAAELEEGMRLNTSVIKQLCSTDLVSGEKKYKDPFKFTPTHTLVLYTNHLPKVGANDDGTWRRLIVIPFQAKIKGKADIKNYSDYLVEHAGGAILSWIIEGAKKAIDKSFKIPVPKCVADAIHRYRENNDWLSSFLEECCEIEPSYKEKSGEFYQEYRAYCLRTGEWTRSTADFYTGLEIAGFERKKTKGGMMILGLRLKSDFMD